MPFIVLDALILRFGWQEVQQAKESMAWPVVKGQIRHTAVAFHPGKKGGGTDHPEVHYTYIVNEQVYSGSKIAFGDSGSSSTSHAQ